MLSLKSWTFKVERAMIIEDHEEKRFKRNNVNICNLCDEPIVDIAKTTVRMVPDSTGSFDHGTIQQFHEECDVYSDDLIGKIMDAAENY